MPGSDLAEQVVVAQLAQHRAAGPMREPAEARVAPSLEVERVGPVRITTVGEPTRRLQDGRDLLRHAGHDVWPAPAEGLHVGDERDLLGLGNALPIHAVSARALE
jgi:hypothetical protein